MKVLASANESTFNSQRKYLRCPSQVSSFLGVVFCFDDASNYLSPGNTHEWHFSRQIFFRNKALPMM